MAKVAQWSADSITGLVNGDPVSTWTDSVSGIAAAGSLTARPTYVTNVMGSKPSVRFDGINDILTIAAPGAMATAIGSQIFSVLMIYQQRSNTAGGLGTLNRP